MYAINKKIISLSLALFLIGLGIFAYLGFYNRYWADDWCYNADFKDLGLWGLMEGYTYITTYASNRFSLTLFSALLQVFAIPGLQWMTFLTVFLWTTGMAALLQNLKRAVGVHRFTIHPSLLAVIIVYFSIYLAPHLYQSIYWRSGLLPYTAPLIFSIWVMVLVTKQATLEKPSFGLIAGTGILSFLAGGFSESGCAFLIALLGLYLIFAWPGRLRRSSWAKKSLPGAITALFFALVAMALLIYSPTSHIRMARYGEPASFRELASLLFQFTYTFSIASIKDYQQTMIFFIASLLGFLLSSPQKQTTGIKEYLLTMTGLAGLALTLVAAAHAPSAYIEKGIPALRAQIIPRFVVISTLVLGGWISGGMLRRWYSPKWALIFASFLLFVAYAYPAYSMFVTVRKVGLYSQRAQAWDARDAEIKLEQATTATSVVIEAIDSAPVGGIRDLYPKGEPGFWITKCAERFYGVKIHVVNP